MEIVTIPIETFYKYCLPDARMKGYKWVVSLVARSEDVIDLYYNLMRSWHSINSITDKYFLFIFAGEKSPSFDESKPSGMRHATVEYRSIINPYVTIMNQDADIRCYSPYDWRRDIEGCKEHIPETQTDAVNALKRFFQISESEIPCLVFTPLCQTDSQYRPHHVVPITPGSNDLYGYFKKLFVEIEPFLNTLEGLDRQIPLLRKRCEHIGKELHSWPVTKEDRLVLLHDELLDWGNANGDPDMQWHVDNRQYKTYPQGIRAQLNRYIDLSKQYELDNNVEYRYLDIKKKVAKNCARRRILSQDLEDATAALVNMEQSQNDVIRCINDVIKRSIMNEKIQSEHPWNFTISGGNQQFIYSKENSTVYATQNNHSSGSELHQLIDAVRKSVPQDVKKEDLEDINGSLDIIENYPATSHKKPSTLRLAIKTLQGIKGSVEFLAAVAALAEFLQTIF